MPNWCDNSVVVYGNEEEVKYFYNLMKQVQENVKVSKHWWTYEMLIAHGYKQDEILQGPFYVGGSLDCVDDIDNDGKDFYIRFYLTTRWSPFIPGLKKLMQHYLSLKFVCVAEEPGCEIYINTDIEGKFFDDRYCLYDDEEGTEYFDSDSELFDYVKDKYGYEISAVSELHDDDSIVLKDDREIFIHRFVSE